MRREPPGFPDSLGDPAEKRALWEPRLCRKCCYFRSLFTVLRSFDQFSAPRYPTDSPKGWWYSEQKVAECAQRWECWEKRRNGGVRPVLP